MSKLVTTARTITATVLGIVPKDQRAITHFALSGYCYANAQLAKAVKNQSGKELLVIWAENANHYRDLIPQNVKPQVDELVSNESQSWGRLSAYFRCVANTHKPEFANAIDCLLADAEHFLEKA